MGADTLVYLVNIQLTQLSCWAGDRPPTQLCNLSLVLLGAEPNYNGPEQGPRRPPCTNIPPMLLSVCLGMIAACMQRGRGASLACSSTRRQRRSSEPACARQHALRDAQVADQISTAIHHRRAHYRHITQMTRMNNKDMWIITPGQQQRDMPQQSHVHAAQQLWRGKTTSGNRRDNTRLSCCTKSLHRCIESQRTG